MIFNPAPMYRRRALELISLFGLHSHAGAKGTDRVVRLPQHTGNPDPQLPYVVDLVRLALAAAGDLADVRLAPLDMQQSRSLAALIAGQASFDLMWSMTSAEREGSGLRVIRFPIDRGLLGWRLMLVRSQDLERWAHVRSLAELKHLTAGQGHDWPDVSILRSNGLAVATSGNYDAMFRMLKLGRFDYVPRSILEIDAELAGERGSGLSIVPGLMLHYPTAAYLFVSPTQSELADSLERGLAVAVQEGSFQALFKKHFGALIQAHPVIPERVLHLQNPLFPGTATGRHAEAMLIPGMPL